MYVIMRKIPSYRVEHFQDDNFYASQYFALLDLINLESELQNKEYKKIEREQKRRRR